MSLEIHIQPKGLTIKAENFITFMYCVICNCLELHPASFIAISFASILQQNSKENKARERKAVLHLFLQKNLLWHNVRVQLVLIKLRQFWDEKCFLLSLFPIEISPPTWLEKSYLSHIDSGNLCFVFYYRSRILWVGFCQKIRIDIMLNGSAKIFHPTFQGTRSVYSCLSRGGTI